jgi:hypothetical protein
MIFTQNCSAGREAAESSRFQAANVWVSSKPRMKLGRCRLEIGDTAGWKAALRGLGATVFAVFLSCAGSSAAGTTNRLDETSFKIVKDNNIFNPKRYPGAIPRIRENINQRPQADYFALVGIISYDQGPFAFFEGSRSEYSKVAKPSDSIAGFKVTGIESNSVQLVSGTNAIAMPINMQMRREEGATEWKLAARSDTYVASNDRNDRSRYDRGRNRNNNYRDNRDNNNTNIQIPVAADNTNQAPDVIVGPDGFVPPPDFPLPPDAAAEQGQGSDTNEDPVLRVLRLRRERENNP